MHVILAHCSSMCCCVSLPLVDWKPSSSVRTRGKAMKCAAASSHRGIEAFRDKRDTRYIESFPSWGKCLYTFIEKFNNIYCEREAIRSDAMWMGMLVLLAETAKFASSAFSSRCAAGSCASAISPTKKLSSLYYERSVYNLLQHKHFLSNGNTSCERRERKRERVRVEGCQIGRGSVLFLHLIALSISFSLLLMDFLNASKI